MNPLYKPMSLPMKLVLWFVVANAYAGAISLIVFPTDTRATFFWQIAPPINAGLFGVLYLAAGSVVLRAVLHGRWEPARYLTAMVPAFTGLMLLTTLLHLDKFDQGPKLYYCRWSISPRRWRGSSSTCNTSGVRPPGGWSANRSPPRCGW